MDGNEKDFVTNQDALAEAQAQIAQAQVQVQAQAQAQAQAPAAAKKKKGSKSWIIWLIALIGVAGYCVYTYFFAYKPTFKVDNYEFTFKTSVKELRDNGIVLCDSYGKESDNNGSVSRKTIYNISYNLGVKKGGVVKKTGFVVQIANFRSSSCKINDCTIYKIYYYP